MFVLRTPNEIQYIPVIVEVIKTNNPFQPEIKNIKIVKKIKVPVASHR